MYDRGVINLAKPKATSKFISNCAAGESVDVALVNVPVLLVNSKLI